MPRVFVCPICGEKVDPKDDYVVYQEKHEEKPELHAHSSCMSKEAK